MNSVAPLFPFRPTRLPWALVGLLLLLNMALAGWVWLAPGPPTPPAAPTISTSFLADTLRFSPAQRVRYDTLKARYLRQASPLAQRCRESCQHYFCLLDSTLTDAQLAARSRAALTGKVAVDVLTIHHLQQVAALCTPAQRAVLHRLLAHDGYVAPESPYASELTAPQ